MMPEATIPQIMLFVSSLGLILAAGYFIARPRKPPKAEPLYWPATAIDPNQRLEHLSAQPWAPQAAAEWERYWEDVGGNSDVLAKIRFMEGWNDCVLGKRKSIDLPYIAFINGKQYHYHRSFSELVNT